MKKASEDTFIWNSNWILSRFMVTLAFNMSTGSQDWCKTHRITSPEKKIYWFVETIQLIYGQQNHCLIIRLSKNSSVEQALPGSGTPTSEIQLSCFVTCASFDGDLREWHWHVRTVLSRWFSSRLSMNSSWRAHIWPMVIVNQVVTNCIQHRDSSSYSS